MNYPEFLKAILAVEDFVFCGFGRSKIVGEALSHPLPISSTDFKDP